LGFDRCKIQITGAAPISPSTLHYFLSVNIPLCDIFGMSETSGAQAANYPGKRRSGTSGLTLPYYFILYLFYLFIYLFILKLKKTEEQKFELKTQIQMEKEKLYFLEEIL